MMVPPYLATTDMVFRMRHPDVAPRRQTFRAQETTEAARMAVHPGRREKYTSLLPGPPAHRNVLLVTHPYKAG